MALPSGVGSSFMCWYCNHGLRDKRQLEIHIKIEHGQLVYGQSEWYGCKLCFKVYHRQQDIVKHMRCQHNSSVNANEYLIEKSESFLDRSIVKEYSCDFCVEVFEDKRLLDYHNIIDHCNGDPLLRSYLCNVCSDQLYVKQDLFLTHMAQIHDKTNVNLDDHVVETLRDLLVPCKCCGKTCLLFSGFCVLHDVEIEIDNCNSHLENHTCSPCHVTFNDCELLWHHKFSEHESGTWKCNLCTAIISSPKDLMSHWSSSHRPSLSKANMFECAKCGLAMNHLKSLKKHIRGCDSTCFLFPCDMCSTTFSSKRDLHVHYRREHEGSPTGTNVHVKFKCPKCNAQMARFGSLKEHLASVHCESKQFSCVVCGASYALQKRLREHCIRKHTAFIKTELSEKDAKDVEASCSIRTSAQVRDEDGNVQYKCETCEKKFSMYSGFMRHVKSLSCTSQTNLTCSYCEKTFSLKKKLYQHYRDVHGVLMRANEIADMKQQYGITMDGVTSYKCPNCTSLFSKFFSLRKHLRLHSGVRPFTCSVCNKSFVLREHLNRHLNIHSGQGYQCNVCGRVMSDRTNLKVHMRNHTGEKKYICEVCGKSFAQWSSHYYHMFTHSDTRNFLCTICEKKFQTPAGLREHKRIHVTSSEKHICETCGNSYSSRKNLLSHVKIHSSERPHKCDCCNATFVRRKYLVQHYKTHTREKIKN